MSLTDLEDRVLVLRDKVDTLAKAFDPNQPRDNRGRWSGSGKTAVEAYHGTTTKVVEAIMREGLRPQGSSGMDTNHVSLLPKKVREAFPDLVESIKTYGASNKGYVFFSKDRTTAFDYAQKLARVEKEYRPIVLQLRIPKRAFKQFADVDPLSKEWTQSFRFKGVIKPEWIVGEDIFSQKFNQSFAKEAGEVIRLFALILPYAEELEKAFDPNQPRDGQGQWTDTGASSAPSSWSPGKIKQAVVDAGINLGPKAKDALTTVAAIALTQWDNSDMNTAAVKTAIQHLADNFNITRAQAREHLVHVIQNLRRSKTEDVEKVADDLAELIQWLDALELDEAPDAVTKLEDRILELRDKADTLAFKAEKD